MDLLTQYFDTSLIPFLTRKGIKDAELLAWLKQDITSRVFWLLSNWRDIDVRRTLLMLGAEEACMYKPKVDAEIACFVNVAIRNSLLETMHSVGSLGQSDMRAITERALGFFDKVDLPAVLSPGSQYPVNKKLQGLSTSYPAAWNALKHLSRVTISQSFPATTANRPETVLLSQTKYMANSHEVVEDAMCEEFNEPLIRAIEMIRNEELSAIHIPCLKTISRSPHKLLKTIELVLEAGGCVVTTNLFISNGFVSKRERFIHPSRYDLSGLTDTHKRYLETQFVPVSA